MMLVFPMFIYLQEKIKINAQRHQLMVLLMYITYMPFAFSWLLVLRADSNENRDILELSLHILAFGPFALQWTGMADFFMKSFNDNVLAKETSNTLWVILYPFFNGISMILYFYAKPYIQYYLDNAKLPDGSERQSKRDGKSILAGMF